MRDRLISKIIWKSVLNQQTMPKTHTSLEIDGNAMGFIHEPIRDQVWLRMYLEMFNEINFKYYEDVYE